MRRRCKPRASPLPSSPVAGRWAHWIRAHDWSRTPLGLPETWPQSLKTAIRIMLTSRQPIWVGWGADLRFFYNDPYKAIIGGKHPASLGEPTERVWSEIWHEIGPMLATAMEGSEGSFVEQKLLIMERNGYPEETYYTFSYSPVPDDHGGTGGIICANSDDTERVVAERQLKLLRELASSATNARSWDEACALSLRALGANPYDIPFALLYLGERGAGTATLCGHHGIAAGHPAAPAEIRTGGDAPWPFGEALARGELVLVEDLSTRFGAALPGGAWQFPPRHAAVVPVTPSGETTRSGVLVVGLNPCRLFGERYRAFLDLVAGQIGQAISYAHAYEEERRRAEALAEIDRAKTTFFSNISHEFRTPLTLMLGPLEELLNRADEGAGADNADRQLVEITHRNGLRLLKLVNALLDFSRIEAGRVQKHPADRPVRVHGRTGLAVPLGHRERRPAAGGGMRAAGLPGGRGPRHVGDHRPEPALNAFKFTYTGAIAVAVREAEDGGVELSIRDTGIGIAEDELPRLFERFHRVSGAVGRSIEGAASAWRWCWNWCACMTA